MLTGISQAIAALNAARDDFILKLSISVQRVISKVHEGVIGRHPVWSGESISAWHWGTDGVSGGGGSTKRTKYSRAQREAFGHTGSLPVGSEPMRAQATSVVNAEHQSLKVSAKDPFHKYILANNHPRTEMLEYGELPTSARSRSPGGMIRITQSEVAAMIGTII